MIIFSRIRMICCIVLACSPGMLPQLVACLYQLQSCAQVAEADEATALNGHSEDAPNPKVADIEMGEVSGAHERANGEAASTTAKSAPPSTSAGEIHASEAFVAVFNKSYALGSSAREAALWERKLGPLMSSACQLMS